MRVETGFDRPAVAYALLRVTLGANLFLHGVTRLLGDHAVFAAYMAKQMQSSHLPAQLVLGFATVLPWVEGAIGLLLLLGVWTPLVLIAGSVLMLVLQVGVCLAQNWEVAGAQLVYVLLLFVLLTYVEWNRYSLDGYVRAARYLQSGDAE